MHQKIMQISPQPQPQPQPPSRFGVLRAGRERAVHAQCRGRRGVSRTASLAAFCTCLMAAGNVCAEPEVVLYGEIDTGLTYANPVAGDGGKGQRWALTSSNIAGSFFGLRGTEDLGGGASALFVIERGIDSANGTAVDGQPVYVGLSDARLGTLTLGLQYDAVNDYLAPLTLTGSDGGTYFAHPFDSDNANASVLTSHTVKWASAEWSGLRLGGQYAINPASTGGRDWSAGVAYGNGPLSLGAAYAHFADVAPGDLSEGAIVTGQAAPDAVPAGAAQTGDAPALRLGRRVYGAGLNYALGAAVLGAVYTHVRYEGTSAAASGRADLDNYEVNARYEVTPAVRLAAGFTHTQGTSHVAGHTARTAWNQIGIHANYAMSRRTDLYAEGVHQRTSNGAPVAFVAGIGASGSDQMSVLAMGVRHRF
ncbi:MAG TPA: porin [Pararobbsia sp.]|nr:porin [Pararobbsia sp.]